MNFRDLQRTWNELGKADPFWAILSERSKKNNGRDKEEFFKTGEAEIEWLMDYVESLMPSFAKSKALDFGCGVGRVTHMCQVRLCAGEPQLSW
jgi:hypothetical protein